MLLQEFEWHAYTMEKDCMYEAIENQERYR